ncbi:30S ribosome-binding factor RbfA [Maritalea mediterranea]|uniref:Ribosome-binding factor A n=1 Tax=Maritalea mediterranea TaxID=2909667 RepID=A0ABS9E2D1_9HYPH|nr:30S ribosome-binding factor RbfA [Maritalea mediterranea]MCF4097010.1 30S ribosome-binding factor RbfA [Maritalea mediterranea]
MSGEKLPSQRQLRVGELVRHALSGFLSRDEIMDEDLVGAFITVPEVRMTPDLKLAKVYIMPLGGKNAETVVAALNRNKKFIRGQIAPSLDLKYAPDFRFFVDDTFDEAGRIDELLRSDRVARDLHHDDDDDQDR